MTFNGTLVAPNVATGGTLGSSVTFTIPAGVQLYFVTKNFKPIDMGAASTRGAVTFQVTASGGITGVSSRNMGWGLYNSTAAVGYYGLWNPAGPYVETYVHRTTDGNNLFSGTNPGEGKNTASALSDGVTYTNQILLFMNATQTGIALGTANSTVPNAGIAISGPSGLVARGYTNPYIPTLGGATTFDEFAFMFTNSTASSVTVTLSAISLGETLTWDASGINPIAPTDGSGNWSRSLTNWSNSGQEVSWQPSDNAVIGANNGAAGTITVTDAAGVAVSNITFNAAGSGNYTIAGSSLFLSGSPTITVANGVTATNSSILGGTGFTKAGGGTLALNPTANNTNVGPIFINGGIVNLANATDSRWQLNGDTTVNSGGVLDFITTGALPPTSTLTINGGAVTNINAAAGKTLTIKKLVLDNNGILGAAYSQATILMTNFDARSGMVAYPRIASSAQVTNFTVKSTPGTVTVQGGTGSSSGVQGMLLTLNGGMMILDYLNPGLYGDSAVRGRLINTTTLTLDGGTLYLRSQGGSGRSETVHDTTLNSGATTLWATNTGTASGINLVMGPVTRNVGGTMDSVSGAPGGGSASAGVQTTSVNNNNILGGWATWAGSDWAVGSASGSSTALSAYTAYTTGTDPTGWVQANNVSLSNPTITVGDGTSINSLKLTDHAAITLAGTLTLGSGGLLITGSAAPTITSGTLQSGNGTDLIIQQFSSGNLTIGSTLANNGGATSLTKSGPGKLIITGTDNHDRQQLSQWRHGGSQ